MKQKRNYIRNKTETSLLRLGISIEEYRDAMDRFVAQRKAAKRRGIMWLFTFDEWVSWWRRELGHNWLFLRGKQRHQYVMARKGDKGAYVPWNVIAILASQNVSDQVKNGTRGEDIKRGRSGSLNAKAILTEKDIPNIRFDLNKKMKIVEIAEKYKVSIYTIYSIRQGKTWGHV